jgi:cellulose biosynthesis protein BcsQ
VPPEPFEDLSGGTEQPQTLPQPRQTGPQPVDGVAARWYALRSIFAPPEVVSTPSLEDRPPMVAVFSLAGGVGKTCLVATLGRALAALGEHVLLADTAAYGPLPLYFGSREFKPGVVRTFSPPGGEGDAPVQVLTLEPERYPGDGADEHDPLLGELGRDGRSASRILVDIGTASRQVTRRLLLLRPTILIPILPDISSVATVRALEAFLFNPANQPNRDRQTGAVFYLLNQFDASSPLHLDVRETLQQQLGDRLLPLVLRRSSAVSEALAEGTTVIDYAPGSAVAEDYMHLAGWLRSFVAPATVEHPGVRWSEL